MVQTHSNEEMIDVIKGEIQCMFTNQILPVIEDMQTKFDDKLKSLQESFEDLKQELLTENRKGIETLREQQNLKDDALNVQLSSIKQDLEKQKEFLESKFKQLQENLTNDHESDKRKANSDIDNEAIALKKQKLSMTEPRKEYDIEILSHYSHEDMKQLRLHDKNYSMLKKFYKLFPEGMCFSMKADSSITVPKKFLFCPRVKKNYVRSTAREMESKLTESFDISTDKGNVSISAYYKIYAFQSFRITDAYILPPSIFQDVDIILGLEFFSMMWDLMKIRDDSSLLIDFGTTKTEFNLYKCTEE